MSKYKKGSIQDKACISDYVKEIYYEKNGECFYIKKLTVKEYEAINREMLKQEQALKNGTNYNMTDLIVITLISGLCDEEGRAVLDKFDYDSVKNFDNELATLLYKEIIELNNPSFVEIKKNIM